MTRFIKTIFAILVFMQLGCSANLAWVQVGVDGLTCSQCCRSVELGLRRLSFVEEVEMSLENTEARIRFKPGARVVMEDIAKAVVDAGFSVRYLKGSYTFSSLDVKENSCHQAGGQQLQFVRTGERVLNGEVLLTFLGKEFLPKSDYKKWKAELKLACAKAAEPLYFVTL